MRARGDGVRPSGLLRPAKVSLAKKAHYVLRSSRLNFGESRNRRTLRDEKQRTGCHSRVSLDGATVVVSVVGGAFVSSDWTPEQ